MEKSASIEDYILTSIRNQRWKQGDKLPSEPEMCQELGVSITTLRIALKTLANRGVIERRRGAGSYVSKDLRANKIIIFVNFESLSLSSGFIYRTVVTHLKERISAAGFTPVLGIATGSPREVFFSNLQFERRDDLNEIVGAISLITCPPKMRRVLDKFKIPCVEMSGINYDGSFIKEDGNHIYLNSKNMIDKGLSAFDRAGIRDFAIFFIDNDANKTIVSYKEFFGKLLRQRGIEPDSAHLVALPWSWDRHESYDEFIKWWQLPNRPSSVFFTEDNICKEALHAIWELGIKIPQELSIVTHSNGEKFHSPVPLTLVEYDTGKIAGILFDTLQKLQSGEVMNEPLMVDPAIISGRSTAMPHCENAPRIQNGIEVLERIVYRDKPVKSEFGCWKSETGYCFSAGAEMFEVNSDVVGNDRYDYFTERFSNDHGESWGESREVYNGIVNGNNIHRYCELFQNLDVNSNSIYRLYLEGTYENDSDAWAGLQSFHRNFRLVAERSFDGGRNFSEPEDLTRIHQDILPNGGRPLVSCSHLFSLSNDSIIIPISCELSPNGATEVKMLHGKNARNGGNTRTLWSLSDPIRFARLPDDLRLTEGSVAELHDGRVVALYRSDSLSDHGGNAKWCKYIAVSEDGGFRWSLVKPLCYTDHSEVCSPCSMPRLWVHRTGRLFFIGNIWPKQVELMRSRNTLSIVEIDCATLRAKPETLTLIDGHNEGDHPYLALSNFTVSEDRRNGDLMIYCPKAYARKYELPDSVLMRYRVKINQD